MKQIYTFLTAFLCCSIGVFAQSPYVSRVVDYKPAPGQFINTTTWGSPSAAQSLVGSTSGHVSLGAYGGNIIVGFDHSIENDLNNPYGVDFTIFGNAFTGWAEPGIVYVMKDVNQNGQADDIWYQLEGSDYTETSTFVNYSIIYANPGAYANVPWRDNLNRNGFVLINSYHTQPYYPSSDSFPNVNSSYQSYEGTLITGDIDDSNPTYIQSFALDSGYADNHVKQNGDPVTEPDNPSTIGTIEGAGGDAMKIEWAIDTQGNPVILDEIDFVKIQTGLNRICGWLGEVSTEICGVVDVAPMASQPTMQTIKSAGIEKISSIKPHVLVYPSIEKGASGQFDLYNIKGDKVLTVSDLNDKQIEQLQKGIYLASQQNQDNSTTYKIIIE